MNRQEVTAFIEKEFDLEGEYLWQAFPDYVVFRNQKNKKWFGLIGGVHRNKLGLDGEGKADVLVLKCDPILIGSLLHNEGFLPAYHMSKKGWISVLLDGELPPAEQVKDLIHLGYELIDKKKK